MKRFRAINTINANVTAEWTLLGIKWAHNNHKGTSFISHPNENVFRSDVLYLGRAGLHCDYSLEQHQKVNLGPPYDRHLSHVR